MGFWVQKLQIPEQAHCICAVGAGGKTSLLYTLAKEYHAMGKKVLLTTTTKMYLPENRSIWAEQAADIQHKLETNGFVVAGTQISTEKMGALPESIWIYDCADVVLVEADGAKRLPLKFPNDTEPVLPKACDFLITVVGLSCIGQELQKVCHCAALVEQTLGICGKHVLQMEDVAQILYKGYGAFWQQIQGCILGNQAEYMTVQQIQQFQKYFMYPCICGSLQANQ